MVMITDLFIIAGICVIIAALVYCVVKIRKNWDVLVRDQRFLMAAVTVQVVLLLFLAYAYYMVYRSRPDDIWLGLALFAASLLVFYEAFMAFKRAGTVKEMTMELLSSLICVMEAGDPNLDGHSLHVMNLVSVFYDYLPSAYQQKLVFENLRYASLFLDVGKLGIPRHILTKPGKLTKEEMDLMRRHPEICVKILGPVGSFSMISDWILYHHERVDGKGYHGLKGDEIPLASRIIAIADTYSALTMDRTYRPTLSYDEAVTELRQAAGTQLDRELVGYFCEIPRRRIDECMIPVRSIMERYQDEHFGE
ncbi:MAG: HD domain-containing protein [Lachnospiraceae bacterium]|nr:HD domain-containing protein [Lachnospiraceae bacterium]